MPYPMAKWIAPALGLVLLGVAACNAPSSGSVYPVGTPDAAAANVVNGGTNEVLNNQYSKAAKKAAVKAANAVYGTANAASEFAVGHPFTAGIPDTQPTTQPTTQPVATAPIPLPTLPSLSPPPPGPVIVNTDTATIVIVNGHTFVYLKPPQSDSGQPPQF
jgi:hypothetical protein